MNKPDPFAALIDELAGAGLPRDELRDWLQAQPQELGDFAADCRAFSACWQKTAQLVGRLGRSPARTERDRFAARLILEAARQTRIPFLRVHIDALYERLTRNGALRLRVDELLDQAAALVRGLLPGKDQLAGEEGLLQRDKFGHEIDQGLFLSAVLRSERAGRHLCQTMLLPRPQALRLLAKFSKDGAIRLPGVAIERRGKAAIVTYENPRFLNAEDQTTLEGMETCVDLVLLDPSVQIGVLRGSLVDHPKYKGRRVFGSGINLTHLYHGRIPYTWYLDRDLGYVNKLYRGLSVAEDAPPDEFGGMTIEKPWIAAVESFAIGGHCQVLLAVDYVIAENTAFVTLPARKEGIIPGAANMRLPRAVGDRLARQAIQYERRFECNSAEGRLICDEIIEPGTMDAAIDRVVSGLTSSGVVSSASNRRAIRIAQEPLDMFRNYFAVYAREQAYCHFSPALIANLEKYWNAQDRKP